MKDLILSGRPEKRSGSKNCLKLEPELLRWRRLCDGGLIALQIGEKSGQKSGMSVTKLEMNADT
jgi:hypothetical protein